MDRPLIVARQEFMDSLIELINGLNLPAFAVLEVIESTIPVLKAQSERQYQPALKK